MPCYHPLKAWQLGFNDNGKAKMLVTSFNIDHLEFLDDGTIFRSTEILPVHQQDNFDIKRDYFTIPCGHCIGCRLEQSRQWATRCLLEMQYHDSNFFVTLTYNDDHLPHGIGVHPLTGEIIETHSLVKRDFQIFMKRLRKEYDIIYPGRKLRYYAAGEYGDHTGRPHYHAIIFGLELNDLVFYKRSGEYYLYVSPFLDSLWYDVCDDGSKQSKGFITVAPATWETAAYTARYCTNKLTGDYSSIYDDLNIIPPFTLMSRKPGIGLQYFEDNIDKLKEDPYIYLSTEKGSRKVNQPKYYKRKFEQIFEEDIFNDPTIPNYEDLIYSHIKDKEQLREEMEMAAKLMSDQTDGSYLDMLAMQETVQRSKLKALERSL